MSKRKRELSQRLEDLFSAPDASSSEEPPLAPDSGLALLVQTLATHAEPTFLATLFERLPLPFYIKDRDHKWVAANPAFCQIIHHQASQLIGRADKEQSDEDWQHDDHVLETGQPEESEVSFTDALGLVKQRPISRLPVLDRAGQAQFVVGFMSAVSETKPVDAADIENEVLKRNRELAAINQISQALATHTDLRTSIKKVGDIIRRLFNVSEAYIALYDRATNMLELPYFIEHNQPGDIPPIPLGQGLSSIVIQGRKPLLINQDTERRTQELGAIITGKQAQSYLGVPILAGDEAIGVISIQSVETPGLFNDDDVQLLTTVAANIGSAIRNAQLFDEAQQAERRFRIIADTTPFPILISRAADDLVLYANERLGPMFGFDKDALIGQPTPDFYFEPTDHEKITKYVRRDGRLINYEVQVKKLDGKPFWTLISLEPMTFNGEPALVSSFYDITERKSIESQVLQRNLQLAVLNRISQRLSHLAEPSAICELLFEEMGQILNNESLYIALYDKATNIISFPIYSIDGKRRENPSRPFGSALTEHIIRTKKPLLIARNAAAEIAKLGIASSGQPAQSWMGAPLMVGAEAIGVIAVQDYKQPDAYRPDQLEVLITVASQAAIALENARLFTQIQQELAERKLTEQELLKLKLGFEQSNDAIFITDIDGKITYVNPGFTKLYGYTSAEAIGQTPRLLKSGLLTEEVYKNFWTALLNKNPIAGEIVNRAKDGRLLTIEGNNNPILDETGTIIGFLGVHRDATARTHDERAIQKRADQLAALNRVGRELVQIKPIDEILESIFQTVGQLFDNRNFFIALPDVAKTIIRYPIYTIDGVRRENYSRAYGHALTEHVLERKQPLLIAHDVVAYLTQIGIESVGRSAQSWMGVPLLIGDRSIGVMVLQDYQTPDVYTPSDVEILNLIASQAAIALENARLFAQTNARVQELAVLNEVGRAASGLTDVRELLELTYRQITNVMRADGFFVGLYDPDRQMLTYPLCYDGGEVFTEPDSPMDPDTHSYQVITTGQPLFIEYTEEQRKTIFDRPETMIGDKEGLPASVLFAPLKAGDQIFGVISVQSYEIGRHTPENLNLLVSIANQVAISLENTRLFNESRRLVKETEQRNAELAIINSVQAELSTALASELNIQNIYDAIGDKIREVFDAQVADIAIYDRSQNLVHFPYTIERGVRFPDKPRPLIGFLQHVFESGQPLLLNQAVAAARAHYGQPPPLQGEPSKSILYVPMLAGGETKGVISLQNLDRENAFSESDVRLLTTLANAMSVALENARLFNESQRLIKETEQRNAELAIINSVQTLLAEKLELQAIYDAIGAKIQEIFDAQVVSIDTYESATNLVYSRYVIERGKRFSIEPRPIMGFRQHVIETRQPLLINQDYAGAATQYGNPLAIQGEAPRSVLYVPMIVGGEAKGVVSLQNLDRENAFSEPDMRLLQTLANAMSVTLENARLFDESQRLIKETEQRNAELGIINNVQAELSAALASELDIQSIYDAVGDKLREIFSRADVGIRIYDPETDIISYPYLYENGERLAVESTPLPQVGFGPHVIHTRAMLVINENMAQEMEKYGSYILPGTHWANSMVLVPLLAGNQARGMITLIDMQREHAFGDSDVQLLQTLANAMSVALENARLFEQTREARANAESRLHESQVLQAFSQTVSSTLDVEQVLDALMHVLEQQMGFTFGAIALIDREAGVLLTARAIGATAMQGMTRSLESVKNDITMDIANKGQIEVIDGWDDRFDRAIYEREGHAKLVRAFVPLALRGQSVGIIEVGYQREKRAQILPEEVRLLATLANSMSVALENARLFEQSRTRAAELTVLNEVAQRLSTRLSTDQVLDETYAGVRKLINAENFYIGLYNEPKHQISFLINATKSETDRQITTMSADDGLSGYIVRNRTSVLINDDINGWAEKMGIRSVGQGARSWLGVPMLVGDQILGVMAVQDYTKPSAYTEHDRDLLAIFANQTATALQNTLLFERTQQDALRERTINRISAKLRNTRSVDQILQIATEELRLATRTDRSAAQVSVAVQTEPNGDNER
jgi:PAS domain S-box-containing protein